MQIFARRQCSYLAEKGPGALLHESFGSFIQHNTLEAAEPRYL